MCVARYNVVCPEGMPLREFDIMRQTIQARVINALRLWVDLSVDFKGRLVLHTLPVLLYNMYPHQKGGGIGELPLHFLVSLCTAL